MLVHNLYCWCIIGFLMQFVQCINSEAEVKCSNCIGNNCTVKVCGCFPGWELVDASCQPFCSPSCFNGICVAPGECKCYPGYEPPRSLRWRGLAAYTCLPYSTTSTTTKMSSSANTPEDVSRTWYTMFLDTKDTTELTETTVRTTVTEEVRVRRTDFSVFSKDTTEETDGLTNTTVEVDDSSTANTTEISVTVNERQNIWIYIVVGLLVLLAVFLIALVVLRKKLYICVKGGSYAVEEQPPKRSHNSFNITFSKKQLSA